MDRPLVASVAGLIVAAAVAGASAGQRVTPARLLDGHPDLHGYWTNATFTPLERPAELGTKEFFTEAEAAAEFKKRQDRYLSQSKTDVHYDDAIWQGETYDNEPNLRTSL